MEMHNSSLMAIDNATMSPIGRRGASNKNKGWAKVGQKAT
jgi:hypothetical protein